MPRAESSAPPASAQPWQLVGEVRRVRARRPHLERVLERDHEVVMVGRGAGGDLAVDLAGEHELDQRRRQRLHVEELAVGDRLGDLLGPVLADEVGDPVVGDHHLERGDAAAVDAREQALADDAAEHAGEDRPHLRAA